MTLLSITEWWNNLSILGTIFWIVAIPTLLIIVIQLVMTIIGADASIDADHGIDFQFISLKNLIAFFTVFGWVGLACIYG